MQLVRVEHSNKKYKEWVRIEWNMGRRCNFDCSYCGADLHDNTSKHMPFEKFEYAMSFFQEIPIGCWHLQIKKWNQYL